MCSYQIWQIRVWMQQTPHCSNLDIAFLKDYGLFASATIPQIYWHECSIVMMCCLSRGFDFHYLSACKPLDVRVYVDPVIAWGRCLWQDFPACHAFIWSEAGTLPPGHACLLSIKRLSSTEQRPFPAQNLCLSAHIMWYYISFWYLMKVNHCAW